MTNTLGAKPVIDTNDFQNGIKRMNSELRVLESGFKASVAGMKGWETTATGLEGKIGNLTSRIEIQKQKVAATREEWERVKKEQGENSLAAEKMQVKINNETAALNKLTGELADTEAELKDVKEGTKKTGDEQDKTRLSTGRLTAALGGLTRMAGATVGALARLTQRIASMAVGLAIGAAKIAATIAVATGILLASTIGPASDLNETLSKTDTVFASMSESVIKNSQAAANQLGINQKAYLDYASALGAALTAGGMGIEDATSLSEQAVEHFADLASFHNAEVADVAESWQSAVRGSYEPIQKYFPFITNEYLKTYGTAKGLIDENTENLTANQRAIILNAIALDTQLNPAYGDFERTSGGLANQQRIFAAQVENARAKIGQGLLPIVTQLVTMLNRFLASDVAQSGIAKLSDWLASIGERLSNLMQSMDGKEFSLSNLIAQMFGDDMEGGYGAFKGLNFGEVIWKLVNDAIEKIDVPAMLDGLFAKVDIGAMIGKLFAPDRGLNLINFGLDIINSIIDSIINGLPNMLPAALSILEKLVEFLTTGLPVLVEQAIPMLLALITGILEALPLVLEAALQIILALVQGISQALPTLIPAIVQALLTIIQTIVDNLPLIIDAALQLILALVQGILLALPILLAAAPEIITGLVMAMLEMLPMIGSAALQLLVALAAGIIMNIPVAIVAIMELVASLGRAIYEFILDTPQRGRDIINGLIEGIKSSAGALYSVITDVISGMTSRITDELDMNSPSGVGKYIGKNFMGSIGLGGEDEAPKMRRMLTRQMLGLANDLSGVSAPGMGAPGMGGVGGGSSVSIGDIIINIPGTNATPQQIAVAAQDGVLKALRAKGGA